MHLSLHVNRTTGLQQFPPKKNNQKEKIMKILVSHRIKDYTHWIKFFEADEPNRSEHGLKTLGVLVNKKDENDLHILFDAPNKEIVLGMLQSEDLKKIMEQAGVVSIPEVNILEKLK